MNQPQVYARGASGIARGSAPPIQQSPPSAASQAEIADTSRVGADGRRFEIVRLTRPIQTHNGPQIELMLTEPTGWVVMKYGYPFNFQAFLRHAAKAAQEAKDRGDAAVDPNGFIDALDVKFDVIQKYLVEMTGLEEAILRQISAGDVLNLTMAVIQLTIAAGN